MSLKYGWGASAVLLTLWAAAAWAGEASVAGPSCGADGCTGACATGACPAGGCCRSEWCCPKYCFPIEKAPRIKFTCVCPKPVCNPCDIEGYGYYPTCWRPWAYPPNYEHCPVPPPGALASQPPPLLVGPGVAPGASSDEVLPLPKKAANPNPNR